MFSSIDFENACCLPLCASRLQDLATHQPVAIETQTARRRIPRLYHFTVHSECNHLKRMSVYIGFMFPCCYTRRGILQRTRDEMRIARNSIASFDVSQRRLNKECEAAAFSLSLSPISSLSNIRELYSCTTILDWVWLC